jgi:biopolymer transport protein ExbD
MAFGGFDNKGGGGHTMSEINMVPLIDVMLVLLVIFIITAPLLSHSIKINIPQVSAEQIEEEPKVLDLAIDPSGQVFLDEKPIALDALQASFAALSQTKPQPEIRIRADVDTRYETLAKVMAAARRGGMTRIGFVTTPQAGVAATPAPAAAPGAGQPQAPAAAPAPASKPAAAPAATTRARPAATGTGAAATH